MDELQRQELLKKLAEASLAKQGGKEIIETDRPVFGQTGKNVRFRTPSSTAEEPVDYAALNNPEKPKDSKERVQQFINKLKEQNKNTRKPDSESELKIIENPAEQEFKANRSSESLNRAIEYMNSLPDDPEARGQAYEDITSEGQLSNEDWEKFSEWAHEDAKRRMMNK